jgi:hypothetical protein
MQSGLGKHTGLDFPSGTGCNITDKPVGIFIQKHRRRMQPELLGQSKTLCGTYWAGRPLTLGIGYQETEEEHCCSGEALSPR